MATSNPMATGSAATGGATASDPPALVFPRPRTLELRRMEVLEAQVRELRAEVRGLKTQLQAALSTSSVVPSGASVPAPPAPATTAPTPPPPVSNEEDLTAASKKRKRTAEPASPTNEDIETSPAPEPDVAPPLTPLMATTAVVTAAVGPSAHSLVQTTEFRETRSALGVTGRKLRQRSCKVCSVLRGDRKRAFETTFFCEQCTASRGGGSVYLCDRVRQHEGDAFRGVTCSQIWHVLWDCGKALPVNGTTIRMRRTRKSEPDGSATPSPPKQDNPTG